mmetsp:Transcript_39927/g.81775  ORF Transcript_39927/g.81775 Transcript_39927/m.81775 type:complete len:81 (-) Transcript_39927:130-372(-)
MVSLIAAFQSCRARTDGQWENREERGKGKEKASADARNDIIEFYMNEVHAPFRRQASNVGAGALGANVLPQKQLKQHQSR